MPAVLRTGAHYKMEITGASGAEMRATTPLIKQFDDPPRDSNSILNRSRML
jgi:hypothetical protein